MKTNSTFKISKQTKRSMAQFVNAHERGAFKRMMIEAEVAAAQAKAAPIKVDKNSKE